MRSEQAVKRIETLPPSIPINEASLADYAKLQVLASSIRGACKKAEDSSGQAIKLVSFIEQLVHVTWHKMKDTLSS